jgi:hypothetical protein
MNPVKMFNDNRGLIENYLDNWGIRYYFDMMENAADQNSAPKLAHVADIAIHDVPNAPEAQVAPAYYTLTAIANAG